MKKNRRLLFYGNFGILGQDVFDGQRTKARNVTSIIKNRYPNNIFAIFNTNNYKRHPIANFFKLLIAVSKSNYVFIYPGSPNSLSTVLLAITLFRKTKKSFYPVVGGFLGDYCKQHKYFSSRLKKFVGIFCETNGLVTQLIDQGFKNVFLSPVFTMKKQLPFNQLEPLFPNNKRIKLCTFGRVCKEKGIKNAIETVAVVREKTGLDISLDIYGKTYKKDNFENEFSLLLKKYGSFTAYKGPLPNESFNILSSYHFMLFPTFFYGEGFPACVLESYMFATPVIASNWKYNHEFVSNEIGYLFELGDNSFEDVLIQACEDIKTGRVFEKKKKAYEYAKMFTADNCLKPLFELIDKDLED